MNKFRCLLLAFACLTVSSSDSAAQQADQDSPRAVASQSTQKMTWQPLSIDGKSIDSDSTDLESDSTISGVSYDDGESELLFAEPQFTETLPGGETFGEEIIYEAGPHTPSDFACDCGSCDSCNHRSVMCGYWLRAEYLLWSLDGIDLPPLATTSPAGTAPEDTGILNQNGTSVLFGNSTELDSMRSGLRITLGWNGDRQGNGFEMSGMGIFQDEETFRSAASLLARPVIDTGVGGESAMLVSHPDFLSGNLNINVRNQLASFDVNRRQLLSARGNQRLDLLLGYRYGNLEEMLRIEQSSEYTAAQGAIIAGTTVDLFDDFQAENHFHGAQIGLHYQQRAAATTWDSYVKVGLGVNRAETTIRGQTTNTVPGGGTSTFEGGLLAQSTNIGDYDESTFMALPEIGFNLTTQIRHDMQFTIGYSMLYWSDAVRVDDAIDRTVSQYPPEDAAAVGRPDYSLETSSYIAHGLSIGAAFQY
ncbi:BBP7 family outer membrane beta-barrel protein [Rhodopirellula sallentina]|nr:BBP7 family outer membrane beta-barrel protein [Rhodopirellula sallentina]